MEAVVKKTCFDLLLW